MKNRGIVSSMKKVRIMHIAQANGGVDRYIKTLLKYIDTNQFENMIVCSQGYNEKDYEGLVVGFEQLEMSRTIGAKDLIVAVKVRRLIKKYHPDVVYCHSSKAGAIGRIANIGLNSKCIYNPHGWAFKMRCSKINRKIYTLIEWFFAFFCDKIICISDSEKEAAVKKKICTESKLKVIYNGVDIDEYEKSKGSIIRKSDLQIPEDAFVVGMVGRISQQKAPDVFVKAAKLIKQDIHNVHFIIVGSGEMENQIRTYAKNNGLDSCLHIIGWVDNPMSYVKLFDVACLLSRWEGFGLVLAEYMLAEKPIVATNVDGISNVIKNNKNGLLIVPDDESDAYRAIRKLLFDSNLRERLVSEGKVDVRKNYDARRVVAETEELIKKISHTRQSVF